MRAAEKLSWDCGPPEAAASEHKTPKRVRDLPFVTHREPGMEPNAAGCDQLGLKPCPGMPRCCLCSPLCCHPPVLEAQNLLVGNVWREEEELEKEKGDKERLISVTASAFCVQTLPPDNLLYGISFNPQNNFSSSVIGFVCLVLPVFREQN